jgi:predicted nuclease of predicted toxin-antitoxin system
VKILLDMNISPRCCHALQQEGIDSVHWSDIGDPKAPDKELLSYAKQHRLVVLTHDLVVQSGKVTAKVTGSRPKPYDVTMVLAKLDDAAWEMAIAIMAGRAQFAAELLSGEMPRDIDAAFGEAGRTLFLVKASDLVTRCSCPDSANPCKHIAATHYVLGEASTAIRSCSSSCVGAPRRKCSRRCDRHRSRRRLIQTRLESAGSEHRLPS